MKPSLLKAKAAQGERGSRDSNNSDTNSVKLYNILEKASQVSGVDGLAEIYARHRHEINAELAEETRLANAEIARIRDELPNHQARKRFDREMRRRPLTDAEKQSKKRSRLIATNLRRIRILRERLSRLSNPEPRLIPTNLWLDCQVIVSDTTGRVIREFARQTENKIAVARIHRAALGFPDGKGKPAYEYAGLDQGSVRARSIFAFGYLLLNLSRGTRRRGKWNRLVTSIPQVAFCAVLADPNSKKRTPKFRNTLSGRHRAKGQPGEIGYLDALKASGFCSTRQAKWKVGGLPTTKGWADIRPEEIAGERAGLAFSLARYWIITGRYKDPREASEQALLWVDWVAGTLPFDVWLESFADVVEEDVHGKTSGFSSGTPPD